MLITQVYAPGARFVYTSTLSSNTGGLPPGVPSAGVGVIPVHEMSAAVLLPASESKSIVNFDSGVFSNVTSAAVAAPREAHVPVAGPTDFGFAPTTVKLAGTVSVTSKLVALTLVAMLTQIFPAVLAN